MNPHASGCLYIIIVYSIYMSICYMYHNEFDAFILGSEMKENESPAFTSLSLSSLSLLAAISASNASCFLTFLGRLVSSLYDSSSAMANFSAIHEEICEGNLKRHDHVESVILQMSNILNMNYTL